MKKRLAYNDIVVLKSNELYSKYGLDESQKLLRFVAYAQGDCVIFTNDGRLLIAERKDVMPLYDVAIPFAIM